MSDWRLNERGSRVPLAAPSLCLCVCVDLLRHEAWVDEFVESVAQARDARGDLVEVNLTAAAEAESRGSRERAHGERRRCARRVAGRSTLLAAHCSLVHSVPRGWVLRRALSLSLPHCSPLLRLCCCCVLCVLLYLFLLSIALDDVHGGGGRRRREGRRGVERAASKGTRRRAGKGKN